MRRTLASFHTDALEWEQRATARAAVDDELSEGLHSYAMDQASIARARAARFQLKWEVVRAQGQKALAHDFSGIQALPDTDTIRELQELEEAHATDEMDDEEMV